MVRRRFFLDIIQSPYENILPENIDSAIDPSNVFCHPSILTWQKPGFANIKQVFPIVNLPVFSENRLFSVKEAVTFN